MVRLKVIAPLPRGGHPCLTLVSRPVLLVGTCQITFRAWVILNNFFCACCILYFLLLVILVYWCFSHVQVLNFHCAWVAHLRWTYIIVAQWNFLLHIAKITNMMTTTTFTTTTTTPTTEHIQSYLSQCQITSTKDLWGDSTYKNRTLWHHWT